MLEEVRSMSIIIISELFLVIPEIRNILVIINRLVEFSESSFINSIIQDINLHDIIISTSTITSIVYVFGFHDRPDMMSLCVFHDELTSCECPCFYVPVEPSIIRLHVIVPSCPIWQVIVCFRHYSWVLLMTLHFIVSIYYNFSLSVCFIIYSSPVLTYLLFSVFLFPTVNRSR